VADISNNNLTSITVCRLLSWSDVQVIAGNSMVPNIAFWPLNGVTNPHYLCDSDALIEISTNAILGLTFLFYYEDSIVQQIEGMMHTYIVSSYFHSKAITIAHTQKALFHFHPYINLMECFR